MPGDLTDALGDAVADHPLVILIGRQRQLPVPPRSDEEESLVRSFTLPAERTFRLTGEARLAPDAPYEGVDAFLGAPAVDAGGVAATASSSLPGCARCRPAAAIDGDPGTAWNTPFAEVVGEWVEYDAGEPITFDHLDLRVVADGRHSVPTRLRIEAGGDAREVDVRDIPDRDSENATARADLRFPALTGRRVRVTVLATREVSAAHYFSSVPRAAPVGIAELGVPRAEPPAAPERVPAVCRDDLLTIDGEPFAVQVVGDRSDAEALEALEIRPCDLADPTAAPEVRLSAGEHVLRSAPGKATAVDVDRLVLTSDAGDVSSSAGEGSGAEPPAVEVVRSGRTSMRVRIDEASDPFWLVLGQSMNAGWTARVVGGDSLGGSRLVDGYANGWRIEPNSAGAFEVEITWTPQRRVAASIVLSLLGAALCAAVVVATWLRRRRGAVRAACGAAENPSLADLSGRDVSPASVRSMVLGALVSGAGAGLIVAPWVGLLVAASVAAVLRFPRARVVLAVLPSLLLGLVGVYMAYRQVRDRLPPVFEWPTLFPRARTLGWLAIVLLAADAVVEVVRGPLSAGASGDGPRGAERGRRG